MDFVKKLSIDKIRNAAEDVINQAKPKSDVEAKVYEALSHKNWGSSSTLLNELARYTFDFEQYGVVTKIMWESLSNNRPAAWRVVFKALTLFEHLIKNGSERCVDDGRNHSHLVRALFNFNYYEGTVDRGIGVREKAKQIVELLEDDERIREERGKAKELREKFGGNLGGVSSYGGGGSGGGGSSYAGYGNESYSSGGGGGGYGNSGIGSSGGGGGDNSFSGRYSDTNNEFSGRSSANEEPSPTFATIPEKKKKKSKKSKKKKEKPIVVEEEAAPAPEPAPVIDLFAFDEPAAPASSNDGFDAFQAAPSSEPPASNSFDAFGNMQAAPQTQTQTQTSQQSNVQFDAFGTSAPAVVSNDAPVFDAFGTSSNNNNSNSMNMNNSMNNMNGNNMNSMNNSMNNMNSMNNSMNNMNGNAMNNMNNMFGNMSMPNMPSTGMQQTSNSNVMGGGKSTIKNSASDEDDFGDFADSNAQNGKAAATSSDPLGGLISLDSLTKNDSKNKDKTAEPIIFNQAAKQYVESGSKQVNMGTSKMSADIAFSGVDGLIKMPTHANNSMGMAMGGSGMMNRPSGQPVMAANGAGNGMNNMMGGQQQQGNNMMGMGMGMANNSNNGGMMMNNNGMGNSNSMGGQMNGMGMQQGGFGNSNNTMGQMNGMGMQQQGMMGGQQQGMMMGGQQMNNAMGGQNQQFSNMQGSTMGGQPMGGTWQ